MQPLVSVIIPAYNSEKYITQCLNSVAIQTYRNLEIIIVLAPSTDNTYGICRRFFCVNTHVIQEKKKTNCATARNIGFNNSRGKYIIFLDADDWWEPENIEHMVCAMENNLTLDWCVHCQILHRDEKQHLIMEIPGTHNEIGGIGGILFRRETLNKIKNKYGYVFDETLNHTDDGDLVLRIRKFNHILVPRVLSHYRWNESGLTANTGEIDQSWGIVKMLVKRGAWDLLPYHIKNLGVCIAEETTGFYLVRKK